MSAIKLGMVLFNTTITNNATDNERGMVLVFSPPLNSGESDHYIHRPAKQRSSYEFTLRLKALSSVHCELYMEPNGALPGGQLIIECPR